MAPAPLTHPPYHTPTYRWGSLHRFQIFKQNRNTSISSSFVEFLLILGVPRDRVKWGCEDDVEITGTIWGFCGDDRDDMGMTQTMWGPQRPHPDKHVGRHLQFLNIVCACMCMHMCVHACGGIPHAPDTLPIHLSPPVPCPELG